MDLTIIIDRVSVARTLRSKLVSMGATEQRGYFHWKEVSSVEKILSELGQFIDSEEWDNEVNFDVRLEPCS